MCVCVCVWNLVSHIKGRTQAQGVQKWGGEEDIWTCEWGCNRRLEKTAQRGAAWFVLFTGYYLGDQIKDDEMGGARGTYGGEEKCI